MAAGAMAAIGARVKKAASDYAGKSYGSKQADASKPAAAKNKSASEASSDAVSKAATNVGKKLKKYTSGKVGV